MKVYWLCLGLVVAIIAGEVFAADSAVWQVGVARAKITPQQPLWMAGYAARDRAAEGTLHDLWVKVLALRAADGRRGVVVTSDLLGFPRAISERICSKLQTRFGLDRSEIMLTSSHTHCGPVLEDALWDIYPLDDAQRTMIREYSGQLETTVVATVEEALAGLKPATISLGESTCGFTANRRENSEADVVQARQQGRQTKGVSDHRVPVMLISDAEGRQRAVLFSYACHATTLSFNEWCGDYPGFAQILLENKHPGALAMFHAGCGADQNPMPRGSLEMCQRYGEMLAASVEKALAQPLREVEPTLRTAYGHVRLDYQPPSTEHLKAMAQTNDYRGRWSRRLLAELDSGRPLSTSYDFPVQVWKLGDQLTWIVLGGEVVTDYALRFEKEFGPGAWITAYANDVMAYIPSERVREEGGYEAGAFNVYGLPAESWSPGIEGRIADTVKSLVDGL
jgi:hypothetical protein